MFLGRHNIYMVTQDAECREVEFQCFIDPTPCYLCMRTNYIQPLSGERKTKTEKRGRERLSQRDKHDKAYQTSSFCPCVLIAPSVSEPTHNDSSTVTFKCQLIMAKNPNCWLFPLILWLLILIRDKRLARMIFFRYIFFIWYFNFSSKIFKQFIFKRSFN